MNSEFVRRGEGQRTPLSGQKLESSEGRDEILTVLDLAERLRVAPSWVYSHTRLLGAYRLGKYLRFSWRGVLERLDSLREDRVGVAAQRP